MDMTSFLFGIVAVLLGYLAKQAYHKKLVDMARARLELSLKEADAREESKKLSDQVLAERLRALAHSADSAGGTDPSGVSTAASGKESKS